MTEDPIGQDSEAIEWLVIGVNEEFSPMEEILLSHAESVHIQGEPYAWFIKRLTAKAPRLERIRTIPAYAHRLKTEYEATKFLTEHGISIEVGNIKQRRKDRKDLITTSYLDKRYFVLYLDDGRTKLLPELKKYAAEDWEIASRYLCLNGEKHLTLLELAEERGVSTGHVQEAVGTVLYYLDSPFDVPLAAVRRAQNLEERILKGREEEKQTTIRNAKLWSIGLSEQDLPEAIPFGFVDEYALILRAWKYDGLSEASVTPRERLVLVRRYGLEDKKFRTLEEVGEELKVTRERIRQIEASAFRRLRALPYLSSSL